MPKHMVLVRTIVAGALAAGVILPSNVQAQAECLSEPDFTASHPGQGRWRYRLDRINNRKCWYFSVDERRGADTTSPRRPHSAAPRSKQANPRRGDEPRATGAVGSRRPSGSTAPSRAQADPPGGGEAAKEALFQDFLQWRRRQQP